MNSTSSPEDSADWLTYTQECYVPEHGLEPPTEEVFRSAFEETQAATLAELLADLAGLGLWGQAHARVALADFLLRDDPQLQALMAPMLSITRDCLKNPCPAFLDDQVIACTDLLMRDVYTRWCDDDRANFAYDSASESVDDAPCFSAPERFSVLSEEIDPARLQAAKDVIRQSLSEAWEREQQTLGCSNEQDAELAEPKELEPIEIPSVDRVEELCLFEASPREGAQGSWH